MIENTTQSVGARAIAQYSQSQAVGGQPQGLFSTALETAMAQGTAAEAAAAPAADVTKASKSGISVADMAPLLLSSLSQGNDSGLLVLLMALLGGGEKGGDLLGGLGGDSSLLGGLGTLLMGSGGGSLFGDAEDGGGFGSNWGSSAASQATMMAAQSLIKTYTQAGQGITGANGGAAIGGKQGPSRAAATDLLSNVGNRSPVLYRSVINQFDVENNPRYAVNQKGTGDTYCNKFMLDVAAAMDAEIPRMNANGISDWLNSVGPANGWHEVTAEQAQALANRGCPAVTTWKNTEGGHGHVQVVSPSEDGAYDPERGVAIAQAGRLLRNYTYIRNIYSTRMKDVQYFAHK